MLCECEHACHFGGYGIDNKGKSAHDYQMMQAEVEVKTIFGTFHVCKQCAENCQKLYLAK